MQFSSYSSTAANGAPSTNYSASSPSSQLQYRHTPGPFSTDQFSSYSSYSTPVTEYPPYPPYSSTPGLSAASYDPAAATASPTLTHPPQRPHHQQQPQPQPPQPPPHYAFSSTPATTECVGISICVPISDLPSSSSPISPACLHFPLSSLLPYRRNTDHVHPFI